MAKFLRANSIAIVLALLAGFSAFFSARQAVAEKIAVLETKVLDISELNTKMDRVLQNLAAVCQKTESNCK